MGFGNNTPRTYFRIKDGLVVVTIKTIDEPLNAALIKDAKRTTQRINKVGEAVTEIGFSFFEGYLQNIEVSSSEYGQSWNVTFKDKAGDEFIWTANYQSQMMQSFFNCLASIDGEFGLFRLQPWIKDDDTRLSIRHNGEKLNWKYSIQEMPAITTLKDADGNDFINAEGKKVYDNKKRMAWLCDLVENTKGKLVHRSPARAHSSQQTADAYIPEPTEADEIGF